MANFREKCREVSTHVAELKDAERAFKAYATSQNYDRMMSLRAWLMGHYDLILEVLHGLAEVEPIGYGNKGNIETARVEGAPIIVWPESGQSLSCGVWVDFDVPLYLSPSTPEESK